MRRCDKKIAVDESQKPCNGLWWIWTIFQEVGYVLGYKISCDLDHNKLLLLNDVVKFICKPDTWSFFIVINRCKVVKRSSKKYSKEQKGSQSVHISSSLRRLPYKAWGMLPRDNLPGGARVWPHGRRSSRIRVRMRLTYSRQCCTPLKHRHYCTLHDYTCVDTDSPNNARVGWYLRQARTKTLIARFRFRGVQHSPSLWCNPSERDG